MIPSPDGREGASTEVYVTTADIRAAVEGREIEILDALGIGWRKPNANAHSSCPYFDHDDADPSWRWDSAKCKAFCSCGSRDVLGVLKGVENLAFDQAKIRAARLLNRLDLIRTPSLGCSVADYANAKQLPVDFLRSLGVTETVGKYGKPEIRIPYCNEVGREVAVRIRYHLTGKKRFRWQKGSKICLYGLDRVPDARKSDFVMLVEGESDCHTLWHHGFPTLGLPGNTQWNEARDAELLDGFATIYVVVEPDQGGETMRKRFAASSILPRVRLVRLGVKDPSALHIDLEGDTDRFRTAFNAALDAAEPYTTDPDAGNGEDAGITHDKAAAEIARLAKVSPLDYAQQRKPAAKKLGFPLGMLDRLVASARGGGSNIAGQGRAVEFSEIEPWPEPVDGAVLLSETAVTLREYVIVSDVQADAIALWSAHTHAFEAADISPKLLVKSAQMRSGKSRLGEVLDRTVPRPLFVSGGIKPAALLRLVESHTPTLLLDEMDALMKQNREMAEALRGIMNSGFNRAGARYIMNVPVAGGGWEPAQFSTWAPQLLSGIGDLPDTVRDRSIEIVMKRKLKHEKVKRLRQKDGDDLRALARKSARWARDNLSTLRDAQPEAPPGLNDRAADAWEPLFAIADCAGGDWPHRARTAALALSGDTGADDTIAIKLLGDLRELFDHEREVSWQEPSGILFSKEIVAELVKREDRPWPEYGPGKPITPTLVAALLKPLEIPTNKTVRRGDKTDKGYKRSECEDAFARYLPPQTVTRSQPSNSAAFGQDQSVTPGVGVTDRKLEKLRNLADCDRVTDWKRMVATDVSDWRFPRGDLWGADIDLLAGGL